MGKGSGQPHQIRPTKAADATVSATKATPEHEKNHRFLGGDPVHEKGTQWMVRAHHRVVLSGTAPCTAAYHSMALGVRVQCVCVPDCQGAGGVGLHETPPCVTQWE